jgi:hypothetical protein
MRTKYPRTHVVLTPLQECYVAALAEGLRLIDAKQAERARYATSHPFITRGARSRAASRARGSTSAHDVRTTYALQHFVREKGKRIAIANGISFDAPAPVLAAA